MDPLEFAGSLLAAAALFGKLLLLVFGACAIFCLLLVAFVARDIYRFIRTKKERRGRMH